MRSRDRWMVGSLMALAMSSAWAGGGRISFSGAVVVPTCAAQTESAVLAANNVALERPFSCSSQPQAASDVDLSAYRLSVIKLDEGAVAGNHLLKYFADYRASAHAAEAQMVTRVYE